MAVTITNRIVGITSAMWKGSTIEGIVSLTYNITKIIRRGQHGGEQGPTTAHKTKFRVRGVLVTDNEALPLTLNDGTTGILVVVGRRAGTSNAITLTFGRTASSVTSGVIFLGTGVIALDQGESEGKTPRYAIPFEGIFHPADTQLENTSANGLITETVA